MWKINVTSSLAAKVVFDAEEVFVSLLYFRCRSQNMKKMRNFFWDFRSLVCKHIF